MSPFKFFNDGTRDIYISRFEVSQVEYEIYFMKLTDVNSIFFSLPTDFRFSDAGNFEICFDSVSNIRYGTHYKRLGIFGFRQTKTLFDRLVRLILTHYINHHPGIYLAQAADEGLARMYQRMLSTHQKYGFTYQIIVQPKGDGYVVRTPEDHG